MHVISFFAANVFIFALLLQHSIKESSRMVNAAGSKYRKYVEKVKASLSPFSYSGSLIVCMNSTAAIRVYESVQNRQAINIGTCWEAIQKIGRLANQKPKLTKEELTIGVVMLYDDFAPIVAAAFEGKKIDKVGIDPVDLGLLKIMDKTWLKRANDEEAPIDFVFGDLLLR